MSHSSLDRRGTKISSAFSGRHPSTDCSPFTGILQRRRTRTRRRCWKSGWITWTGPGSRWRNAAHWELHKRKQRLIHSSVHLELFFCNFLVCLILGGYLCHQWTLKNQLGAVQRGLRNTSPLLFWVVARICHAGSMNWCARFLTLICNVLSSCFSSSNSAFWLYTVRPLCLVLSIHCLLEPRISSLYGLQSYREKVGHRLVADLVILQGLWN